MATRIFVIYSSTLLGAFSTKYPPPSLPVICGIIYGDGLTHTSINSGRVRQKNKSRNHSVPVSGTIGLLWILFALFFSRAPFCRLLLLPRGFTFPSATSAGAHGGTLISSSFSSSSTGMVFFLHPGCSVDPFRGPAPVVLALDEVNILTELPRPHPPGQSRLLKQWRLANVDVAVGGEVPVPGFLQVGDAYQLTGLDRIGLPTSRGLQNTSLGALTPACSPPVRFDS